ncbi:feoA family protein [Firmicutes bacterium CAG:449]|nr:feoA family protein [Firmicutes bacterium CAG:449]
MPIVLAPLDQDLKVVKILADEKTKKHLESLGITINSTIKVLSKSGGNVICIVKDGRLALDSNLSTKILVA